MRVLNFIATLGPGGAERQLSVLAPALASMGVETHVAYGRGGPNLARLESSGVHLHALEATGNHSAALALKVVRLIRRIRPDAVQTWLLQMDILGGVGALLCRTPFILSERSSSGNYAPTLKNRARLFVGGRAACIVANSGGGIDYWRGHASPERLRLVRNCVLLMNQEPEAGLDDLAAIPPGQPVVLFAGRFSYEKNIPSLLEALVTLSGMRPDVKIMMFGEGPERLSATQHIEAAGLADRIVIADFSSHLAAWMARASVFVSVSHHEGHPNTVMEAATVGCPLVLSDIPSHRELFDETSAMLVSPGSPEAILQSILAALNDRQDASRRAERARAIAAQFDLESAALAYRRIYDEVVAAST